MLAGTVTPNATKESLVEVAKTSLHDMAQRGNIPATSFRDELNSLCELASRPSELLEGSRHPHHLGRLAGIPAITVDAEALNNALVNVLGGGLDSDSGETSDNHRGNVACAQEPQAPVSGPNGLGTFAAGAVAMAQQTNEIYLNDVGLAGDQFSFDLADLQWLDSMQ